MGRYATDAGSTDFAQPTEGPHLARCIRLIDLGTHHDTYEGKALVRNQVLVTFELPGETVEIEGEQRPMLISKFYTNSLNEKANLRKDLESWRGRRFTDEEQSRFDLTAILGMPAMLSIVHNVKGKAQIKNVSKVIKGMNVPNGYHDQYAFWLDEFDAAIFEEISEGLKKIIMDSDEYKERLGKRVKQPTREDINRDFGQSTEDTKIPF